MCSALRPVHWRCQAHPIPVEGVMLHTSSLVSAGAQRLPGFDGGLTHRLCGPRTGPVLQQAADARTAVCEAVHGTFRNGYVPQSLGHINTCYHPHVPTSLRTMSVSLSFLLVDTDLMPLYLCGATSIVRGVPYCVPVPCRTVVSAALSGQRRASLTQSHRFPNLQVPYNIQQLRGMWVTASYSIPVG